MKFPLVSVCIPTFNGAKFLKEALDSVQHQTYSNLEIIISDDNSQDNSIEIIENFKNKVKIPVYIYHHSPRGIGANWNNCIQKANGEYIKFLFQDDILFSTCIQKLVGLAESDKIIGMVYCKRKFIIDEEKEIYRVWVEKYGILHTYWNYLTVKEGSMIGQLYLQDPALLDSPENKIGEPSAVLIRKECFDKIGYFNTELKQALDVEFWWRIMKIYKVGFVDEFLIYFRLHKNQASQLNYLKGTNDSKVLKRFYFQKLFWHMHPLVRRKIIKKAVSDNKIFKLLNRFKNF